MRSPTSLGSSLESHSSPRLAWTLGTAALASSVIGLSFGFPLVAIAAPLAVIAFGITLVFRHRSRYIPSVEHFTPPMGTPLVDLPPHYGMPKGIKGGPESKTAEHGTPTVKVGISTGGLELAATPVISAAGGLVEVLRSAGLNTFLSTRGRVEIVVRDDRSSSRGTSASVHQALVSPHALLGSLVSGATHGGRGANAWRVVSSKSDPTDPGRWTAVVSAGDKQFVLRLADPAAFRSAVKGTERVCSAIERDTGGRGLERNLTKH